MDAPKIQTAIPQRRYRLGEYEAVVLGDIESGDARRYKYILALVRAGETKPRCFVTAERATRERRTEGSHVLWLVTEAFVEDLGASDAWGDIDAFSAEALTLAARTLGIEAQPIPI